jgi:hypothetical protein
VIAVVVLKMCGHDLQEVRQHREQEHGVQARFSIAKLLSETYPGICKLGESGG